MSAREQTNASLRGNGWGLILVAKLWHASEAKMACHKPCINASPSYQSGQFDGSLLFGHILSNLYLFSCDYTFLLAWAPCPFVLQIAHSGRLLHVHEETIRTIDLHRFQYL